MKRALPTAFRLGQHVQDVIRYDVDEWLSCSIGLSTNHFLAKVASDLQKPQGLSVIAPEDLPHKLFDLALTDWPGIGSRMARRFDRFGVSTTEEMYRLDIGEMKHIFGGINRERWWRMIRGQKVTLLPVKRFQIGHSNVLAPEFRSAEGAWSVACRLLEKAATCLRSEGYLTPCLCLSVTGFDNSKGWARRTKFDHTGSTGSLMRHLERLWRGSEAVVPRPAYVSIALQEIARAEDVTASLFDQFSLDLSSLGGQSEVRTRALDQAIDWLNDRFGAGSVVTTSAMRSVSYLEHGRIPFGKPR